MQRALTSLLKRSLVQRSFTPSTASSNSLVRQLHAGRRLADEFAASPSALDGESNDRPARTPRPERLPNGVFVGGLNYTMSEEDLKRVFGQIGEVKAANVVYDRDTQRSKRYGFVYFANPDAVETAISDPSLVEELGPSVGVSKLKPAQKRTPRNEESQSVFIAGFPPSMDKKDIESSLSEFYPSSGVIDDLFLPLNRIERMEGEEGEESSSGLERHNKGYCFVRFTNKEDAKEFLDKFTQAVQDGFKFQGSKYPPIGNFALPKTNREEQPEGQNDRRGPRSGRRDRNGRDQERNGGARDWINEDRGRYSSRSDDI